MAVTKRDTLVGAVGALLVAVVSGLFLLQSIEREARLEARLEEIIATHADFMSAVAELTQDGAQEMASARGRLAIYGDSSVVAAMAAFLRAGGNTGRNPDEFVAAVLAMRGQIYENWGRGSGVDADDIKVLLLGPGG